MRKEEKLILDCFGDATNEENETVQDRMRREVWYALLDAGLIDSRRRRLF